MSSKTTSVLTQAQLLLTAELTLKMMRRQWFSDSFPLSRGQLRYMPKLLMTLGAAFDIELSMKTAMKLTGAKNPKTAKKYIDDAVDLELIAFARSTRDKRLVLLFPTPKLVDAVAFEEKKIQQELKSYFTHMKDLGPVRGVTRAQIARL